MGRKPKKKRKAPVQTRFIELQPNDFLNDDVVFNATSDENVKGAIAALLSLQRI